MIEYEIKNPSVFNSIGTNLLALVNHSQQQQAPNPASRHWGKIPFIAFLEETKLDWPKGMLVTYNKVPIRPGEAPGIWATIFDYNELHYNAPVDPLHNQPKIIFARSNRSETCIWFAPDALRKLTEEEALLALSRDSTTSSPSIH